MVSSSKQYKVEKDDNFLLFRIENKIIDDSLFLNIKKNFKNNLKTVFDLEKVETINSRLFVEYLSFEKVSLFGAKNEILAYLSIVLKRNFPNLYQKEKDFKNDSNMLIKRNFKLA